MYVSIYGKTRLLVYCICYNNNKAESVLSLFQRGVQLWGLSSIVRSDYGMKIYLVGAYTIKHCGPNRGSITSVHNSRVERSHCDIFSRVLVFYPQVFKEKILIIRRLGLSPSSGMVVTKKYFENSRDKIK